MSEEEKKIVETVENFIKYYKKNEQTGNRANLDVLREECNAIEFILNKYDIQQKELEQEKEKNKKILEQNKDMKSLFNVQSSIAKELDFNTNEKMVKFKDEYYVPDTMTINANIGEPKTIELRYISATKYLTKFDEEEWNNVK